MNGCSKIKVLNGIDNKEKLIKLLSLQRIGLLTSASGVNKSGESTCEILSKLCKISVLFSPEHGIKANLQDGLYSEDVKDEEFGASIFDAGKLRAPDDCKDIFDKFDVAVYDIQDVGARYYTYLYNLTDLMICCAKYNKTLIVLDRINIIGGHKTEGPILDIYNYKSNIGRYAIPTRYGLTIGEFASMINETENIGCELEIISCEGWKRNIYGDQTDLLFVNPSPNIPSNSCAFNYIGTCIFEATNASEGRGTTIPFNIVGAPFVNTNEFYSYMNSKKLDGCVFRKVYFTPKFNKHENLVCNGLEIHVTDRETYDPVSTGAYMFAHLCRYSEFEFNKDGFAKRFGNAKLCDKNNINDDKAIARIIEESKVDAFNFSKNIANYHIYD